MGQPFHAPCVSILFVAICLLIGCMTRSQFLRILGQKYIDDEFVNIDKIFEEINSIECLRNSKRY
jgi:ACR3 family arsenite efflux pump ArsB